MTNVTEQEVTELVDFLKVLADKNRLRILGLISEKELTVREIAAALEVREPTASWHLTMLKMWGMVTMRAEGNAHYYKLRQDGVHALLGQLSKRANDDSDVDPDSSEFEKHVLRHFFKDGKLLQIPVKFKKQLVVLRRLVKEFRYGEFYSEKQVNEIIVRFHPDFAALRRMLIDNKMMARENGRYWRLDLENPPDQPPGR